MRKTHKRVLLLVVVAAALAFASGPIARGYEALLVVAGFAGYSPPALLDTRSGVTVNTLCIGNETKHYYADLYLPEDSPRAGIVLLHGAAQTGKDDPRLTAFARQLAGRRFVVLVPELPGPKRLQVRAEDTQYAVDAFRFLDRFPGIEGRVGIGGISISAGLAFLAALRPELRDEVDFILSIGGYHSLPRTLEYSISGRFLLDGEWRRQPPNNYGKWLYVLSNLDVLRQAGDRVVLERIALKRMLTPGAAIDDLTAKLSDEGKQVLAYVTETDPQRLAARYAALPDGMRRQIEALDLANKDLSRLTARVLLIHGYDDNVIPYSESVSLFRALPPQQAELFLVHGLAHVDSRPQQLQDAWRMWRAAYAMLQERDLKG